jgi:signal transduction histidine kinase
MTLSSRHLPSAWRSSPHPRGPAGGEGRGRQLEGVWPLWERLRSFDRRHATAVDVALAGALFLLFSGWLFETGSTPNIWLVAALTFPLVLRRRAPMGVFLTISAVALVQWFVTGPALADASLLVALYTVAAESEWLSVIVASVILEVGIVMATVRFTPTANNTKSVIFLNGMAFTALLAGVVVRALRSQLDWLAERAERLEVERDQQASIAAAAERARIAREMHDVVSHNLQVMVTLADAAAAAQATDPARASEAVREVSSTGRQALTDMRRMLGVLREEPPLAASNGSDAGAAPASPVPGDPGPLSPQPGLGDLQRLVERVRGTGLAVSLASSGRPFELTSAAGLTVYRIVQEALTNVLKHAAEPSEVEVRLEFDEPDVTLRVTDDGRARVGASAPGTPGVHGPHGTGPGSVAGSGHGLAGMAERTAAFGGTLTARPRPGGGWEVVAVLRDGKAPASA